MASGPFAEQPKLPFPLQEGERVIQLCRRHWWFLWPRTILWAAFALVPVAAAAWALERIDVLDDTRIVFGPVAALWLLFWAARLLLNWYQYTRDIWVITNQRIVDSTQPTPFRHHLATADLINVQDISVEKTGIIPSMLNFGDVLCQTAGTGSNFRIGGVPHPADVQLLIDKERDRERGR
ncbi:MAG: hypothetical protein WEE64_12555 [Dehalococcoidia bacterium]